MNYSRQYLKYLKRKKEMLPFLKRHIQQIKNSQMFTLPSGGSLVTDAAVEMLDRVELINLPFKDVILEYWAAPLREPGATDGYEDCGWQYSDKRIVFLKDLGEDIAISSAWDYRGVQQWGQTPFFLVEKKEFLKMGNGQKYAIAMLKNDELLKLYQSQPKQKTVELTNAALRDVNGEVCIAARFLAALACKNVETDRISLGRSKFSKNKGALPYNTYHRLVIKSRNASKETGQTVDRRSPREHLRRGHIRHLSNGEYIWINSALINAGIGGKVSKDYAIS